MDDQTDLIGSSLIQIFCSAGLGLDGIVHVEVNLLVGS